MATIEMFGRKVKAKNYRIYSVCKKAVLVQEKFQEFFESGIVCYQTENGDKRVISTMDSESKCKILEIKYPKENDRREFFLIQNEEETELTQCFIYFTDDEKNMFMLFDRDLQDGKAGYLYDQACYKDNFLRSCAYLYGKLIDKELVYDLKKIDGEEAFEVGSNSDEEACYERYQELLFHTDSEEVSAV